MLSTAAALARRVHLIYIVALIAASGLTAAAATLPAGFAETILATGIPNPTAMQIAPDGRIFVAEQGGRLRVIKDGQLLATPFLTVTVSSVGERGLLGIAFDPAFATNGHVYIYYTATSPTIHNRISRFTAAGDVAAAGSEVVILDLDNLSSATNHNGGALAFGPDGKLYAAVGENATPTNAQSMTTLHGKMLRINKDGSIPTDNPFFATAAGKNRAIWALGLRNPFTFAFNPAGTQLFINDVGQSTWEEINDGRAGANYGWPESEGPTTDPRFTTPIYAYGRGSGCAITGGAFYSPAAAQFPAEFAQDYFFADYCAGWIKRFDISTRTVANFASGISAPVDLKVGDDGSLYYLARGTGSVIRVRYGAAAPSITTHPASQSVRPGASVTFSVRASGTGTLRYQWQRNGVAISGATSPDYTLSAATLSDNGARFRAIVSNDAGNALSNEAVLTVTENRAPVATITQPVAGTLYTAGTVISYAGTGSDAEDGALPAAAFTWQVDFHHDSHVHPFIAARSGATSGSFTIPTTGETSANVWYRILLTVRDSSGATHRVQRDILPRKVRLTLAANVAGLQLRLDGQPVTAPFAFDSVAGMSRSIAAVTPQSMAGVVYTFSRWSDAGAASHTISTPTTSTTYTATYAATGSGSGTGLSGTYFNNSDFTSPVFTRVDPTVNFDWASGSPDARIAADTFSIRWTGQIEAPLTDTYRFYTQSNDGVRLWINGQQIINNWTTHSVTENSGTIALTAGQRYDIRLEYFENAGTSVIRLLWSTAAMAKTIVPASRLYPSSAAPQPIRVNFQTASAAVPAGYLVDSGAPFAARGNGQTYGWNADNAPQARDRNAANSPDQRYDTLIYMQRAPNAAGFWELALPNGTYRVRIVAGDPVYFDNAVAIAAEGTVVVSGTTSSATRWLEGTAAITVTDGRLTVGSVNTTTANKICFIEVTPQ